MNHDLAATRDLRRRTPINRARYRRGLHLDLSSAAEMRLESRTLLSANFPLTTSAWTSLGPAPITNGQTSGSQPVSGRVAGIAASPTSAGTYYIAAAGGGVWKTTDAGSSWAPITDGQASLSMGAIAVAPSDENVVYAGTGEANNSADSNYGVGILRSADGGATWSLAQGPANIFATAGLTTSKIAVDPTNPSIAYAAMGNVGQNKAFVAGAGVYKTTDGGATWANTTASISTTISYSDVVINPVTPSTLYMAAGPFYGNAADGVYQSTNSGASWTLLNLGVSNANFGRISLAVAPSNPQVVYATIAGSTSTTSGGVHLVTRSDDGGASWNTLILSPASNATLNYMGGQGWYDQWVAVNPTDAANVFVGGAAGSTSAILESTTSGVSWSTIARSSAANGSNGPHADHHAAAFTADGKLLDGNDGGIWRLDNASPAALKWTDLNASISTIQLEGIALSPTNPAVALGGSQDNGTERFTDSPGWTLTDGGDGGQVRFSRQNPNIAYHVAPIASFGAGNYFRKSANGGQNWSGGASGLPSSGADENGPPGDNGPDSEVDPGQSTDFYPPFNVDPNNDQRLILGSSDLYITTNGATNWTNLTTGKPGWVNTRPADAVAISNTNSGNTIYAATGGTFASTSSIFVSTNGGASWAARSLPSGTGRVSDIQIDPTNDQVAYAVTSTFASNTGHVWRTANAGVSWTNIGGNLPNLPTWTLQIDAAKPNTLYIGNDTGVYATTDLGASWSPLAPGLPPAQVYQLDLNAAYNTLGAGTHGRGLYEILTRATSVTDVTSTTADGAYGVGSTIAISVTFGGVVFVTGTPTLALNSGGTATYAGGSGTATLTFNDTVAAGESSPDLDYSSTSALSGTIKDANGNFASNALPAPGAAGSLGANKDIVIETVAPSVLEYRVLFGSTSYNLIGSTRFDLPWQVTGIRVVFSEPITAGSAASLGGLSATSLSGLGTSTLTFGFAPISVGSFATTLAGTGAAALTDAAGNPLAAGAGFAQGFKVLYGDLNADGVVSATDFVGVYYATAQPYSLFADLNGDGVVDLADVRIVRARAGAKLP